MLEGHTSLTQSALNYFVTRETSRTKNIKPQLYYDFRIHVHTTRVFSSQTEHAGCSLGGLLTLNIRFKAESISKDLIINSTS